MGPVIDIQTATFGNSFKIQVILLISVLNGVAQEQRKAGWWCAEVRSCPLHGAWRRKNWRGVGESCGS